jgi:hypothetical protein
MPVILDIIDRGVEGLDLVVVGLLFSIVGVDIGLGAPWVRVEGSLFECQPGVGLVYLLLLLDSQVLELL